MRSSSTTSELMEKSGGELRLSAPASSGGSTKLHSSCVLSTRQARIKQFIVVSLFFVGLIVCVTSLICILLLPTFVTNQISKKLVLKNNSLLLERWSKPNVPMFFKVWIFDVQNAQEIIEKRGTKPQLKELGPFVFQLRRQKDIVSFAGDNLYYTERKIYHFKPELSCCAINTTVTIPNIPLVAVVDRALSYNLPLVGRFIPRLINRAIQSLREQLFVRRQVREILFDGYDVDLLKMVSRVGSLVGLPQTNQRFALLKGRNDSWRPEQDGVWAINTGVRDRRLFGKVSSWNSYKQLPFWAAPQCNVINGSDGTLFPPPIKKSEPLYIFNQELCRTVNLIYERPSDIRAIKAYRFVLNPLNFAHTMQPSGGLLRQPQQPTATVAAAAPITPIASTAPNLNQLLGVPQPAATPSQQPAVARSAVLRAEGSELRPSGERRWKNQRQAPPLQVLRAPSPLQAATNQQQQQQQTPSKQQLEAVSEAKEAQRLIQVAQEAHLDRQAQSKVNPNTCFCDRKSTNLNGANVCEFDGLIDLSKCTKQAQVIFGSMPHFYQSDPRLLRQVSGLQPNATRHTTFLDIEPNTGLVLGGKRRVQLNLIIKHNNQVDGFENINDMLVPLVWFEESALIPEESARKFKSLYTDRIRLVNLVLMTLFLAAVGLLAIDVRLLASHYSHCFQIKMTCNQSGSASSLEQLKPGSSSSTNSGSSSQTVGAGKRRALNLRQSAASLAANLKTNLAAFPSGKSSEAEEASGGRRDSVTNATGAQLNLPLLAQVSAEQQLQQQQPSEKRALELNVRYEDKTRSPVRPEQAADGKSIIEIEAEQANKRQ